MHHAGMEESSIKDDNKKEISDIRPSQACTELGRCAHHPF